MTENILGNWIIRSSFGFIFYQVFGPRFRISCAQSDFILFAGILALEEGVMGVFFHDGAIASTFRLPICGDFDDWAIFSFVQTFIKIVHGNLARHTLIVKHFYTLKIYVKFKIEKFALTL